MQGNKHHTTVLEQRRRASSPVEARTCVSPMPVLGSGEQWLVFTSIWSLLPGFLSPSLLMHGLRLQKQGSLIRVAHLEAEVEPCLSGSSWTTPTAHEPQVHLCPLNCAFSYLSSSSFLGF